MTAWSSRCKLINSVCEAAIGVGVEEAKSVAANLAGFGAEPSRSLWASDGGAARISGASSHLAAYCPEGY